MSCCLDLWMEEAIPYKSKAQIRYMHAKHPDIAKRWDAEGYTGKGLPQHVKKKSKKAKKHGR
jgi:hypothetical protein